MPPKHPQPASPQKQFTINPPLLNSANPWATTEADLKALYDCPYTGAVTIRTSLWKAFNQHPSTHQYTFFSSTLGHATANINVDLPHGKGEGRGDVLPDETSSLNTLGYSPIAFEEYVAMLVRMSRERTSASASASASNSASLLPQQQAKTKHSESEALDLTTTGTARTGATTNAKAKTKTKTKTKTKPFIVSVTGSAEEVAKCCELLLEVLNEPEKKYPLSDAEAKADAEAADRKGDAVSSDVERDLELDLDLDLMMEINLSCPNIPDKPPPAYDGASLAEYITAIGLAKSRVPKSYTRGLHVGIKTPPYTYQGQFQILIDALERSSSSLSSSELDRGEGREGNECPISFITATNTLGSCLVLNQNLNPALGSATGAGIGGLAGDALHPIALGNVKTIRTLLDASTREDVRRIAIIGVGGVRDKEGFSRMRAVGAEAVGVGTALGREGVGVFEGIARGFEG
ncbi:dihydroorotate dehydrogenase [Cadophora gregata]|uniref:dihydroorotate dehydrogenase n=1 Tax=Cadophora gregata TaxID=51156 RepID=UPI0026DBE51F|nr:dihydroorotate dehydrogenase [Cadophora gregata]KAK0116539.1 dihydroorotate dehydrogenase [Cadophora gregata]